MEHIANGEMVTMTLLQGVITRSCCSSPDIAFRARHRRWLPRDGAAASILVVFATRFCWVLGSLLTAWFSASASSAGPGWRHVAGRESMMARCAAWRRTVSRGHQHQALATLKINGAGMEVFFRPSRARNTHCRARPLRLDRRSFGSFGSSGRRVVRAFGCSGRSGCSGRAFFWDWRSGRQQTWNVELTERFERTERLERTDRFDDERSNGRRSNGPTIERSELSERSERSNDYRTAQKLDRIGFAGTTPVASGTGGERLAAAQLDLQTVIPFGTSRVAAGRRVDTSKRERRSMCDRGHFAATSAVAPSFVGTSRVIPNTSAGGRDQYRRFGWSQD